jgi:hypothetical protein
MARRKSKIEAPTVFMAILALAAIALAIKFISVIGIGVLVVCAIPVAIFAGSFVYARHKRAVRLSNLRGKYADESIVQALMRHEVWEGQTREQLLDARGQPLSIDNVLMKTRTREVWKYQPNGRNRYRLRITLDDGVVVSYEQRRS